MRQILAALTEYYDRLIVFVVLIILFASLMHLTVRKVDLDQRSQDFTKKVNDLTPKHPIMAPVTSDPYDVVMASVKEPFQIPAWSNTIFGPEKRIRCMGCMKPAPIGVEKCPFCGELVGGHGEVEPQDADKDGMRDDWEKQYGLNPRDAADADLDPDQDGFSNLEEFSGNTNPNDPAAHPDYIRKVKVAKAYQVPFVLRFRSHMQGSDSNRIFQVNTVDNGRTYMVRLGEKVGEKGGEFVVEGFEAKEMSVTNSGNIVFTRTVDVSVLTLKRGDRRIALTLNQPVDWPEVRAALSFPLDSTNWLVKVKDTIAVRQTNYVVMDIDSKAGTVVLRRPDVGTTFTVGANGVVGVSAATRTEPEAKSSQAQEGE